MDSVAEYLVGMKYVFQLFQNGSIFWCIVAEVVEPLILKMNNQKVKQIIYRHESNASL